MKTRGAILREAPGRWEVVELDLDEPRRKRDLKMLKDSQTTPLEEGLAIEGITAFAERRPPAFKGR